MSLNELNLNPHLVAQLFPRTLVQEVDAATPAPAQMPSNAPALSKKPAAATTSSNIPTAATSPTQMAASTPAEPVSYLGHFQQQILVIVEDAEAKFIGDEALAFLTKVLQACQLTLADVAIANAAGGGLNAASLADLKPKVVLEFGTSFFGSNKPFYQAIDTGFFTLLRALPIQALLGNDASTKQEKAKLWQALQSIFLHGK